MFIFRHALLTRTYCFQKLETYGLRCSAKASPHQLRFTCATQLLNAGCRVTSIQRFLGHKKLSSTMIYARAHDQTVAEDYFAAMQRVEERLEILPQPRQNSEDEVVKVRESTKLFQLIQRLETPQLGLEERLATLSELRTLLSRIDEHPAPDI